MIELARQFDDISLARFHVFVATPLPGGLVLLPLAAVESGMPQNLLSDRVIDTNLTSWDPIGVPNSRAAITRSFGNILSPLALVK